MDGTRQPTFIYNFVYASLNLFRCFDSNFSSIGTNLPQLIFYLLIRTKVIKITRKHVVNKFQKNIIINHQPTFVKVRRFFSQRKKMFGQNKTVYFLHLIFALNSLILFVHGSEDILASIRLKHERIGQCRIGCLRTLSRQSDCQRQPTCKSCWSFCSELSSLSESRQKRICKSEECDLGCKSVCNFFEETIKKSRELSNELSKEISKELSSLILSTKFVGCTLYWKTSGDEDLIFVYQLYGMDRQVKTHLSSYQIIAII
jgi:hypothetical protein